MNPNLQRNLRALGFWRAVDALEKMQRPVPDRFEIPLQLSYFDYTKEKQQPVNYLLHFHKDKESGGHKFVSYDASLHDHKQTFLIKEQCGFTSQEAYNLLLGRYVQKNLAGTGGEKCPVWLGLDFSGKDDSGNFLFKMTPGDWNMEDLLKTLPIRNVDLPSEREQILKDLKSGCLALCYHDDKENEIRVGHKVSLSTGSYYEGELEPYEVCGMVTKIERDDPMNHDVATVHDEEGKTHSTAVFNLTRVREPLFLRADPGTQTIEVLDGKGLPFVPSLARKDNSTVQKQPGLLRTLPASGTGPKVLHVREGHKGYSL